MKIKIKINEGMGCVDMGAKKMPNAHNQEEARMHRTTLAHLMADVKVLLRLIEDGDDLPEWLESKITKAGDYMSSAARYIAGSEAREQGQLEEQVEDEETLRALAMQAIQNMTPDQLGAVIEMNPPEQVAEQNELLNEYATVDEYFDLYEALQDAVDEDGNTPCPQCLYETMVDADCGCPDMLSEAEYKGRKVQLNKRLPGDVKKFKAFVKGCGKDKSRVKKVNFGDKKMKIKKSNPKRRKSFRARHKCHTANDKCTFASNFASSDRCYWEVSAGRQTEKS